MRFEQSIKLIIEKIGATYDYSCVLIELPKELSDYVKEWGNKNIPEENIFKDPKDPSFGRENHIHVTAKYGIHDAQPDKVKEILKDFGEIGIKLGKISRFKTNDDFDVLKIGIISNKLHKLHKKLKEDTKNKEDYNVYKPHVTVAYVLPNSSNNLLNDDEFDGEEFTTDKVKFQSKNGSNHTIHLT